jgi:hypothetical protein
MIARQRRARSEAPRFEPIEFSLAPRRVLSWLLAVIALLLLAATLCVIAWLGFGRDTLWGLRRLLDVGAENTIPTYFSALQLLAAAVLLAVIARHQALIRAPWRWHFFALAIGFVLLSVDEMASLHETLLRRLGDAALGDLFYFKWLGPGIVIVTLAALCFLPFLLALPRRFRLLFTASGAVFLAGALGAELIGSEMARQQAGDDASWALQFQVIVEEGLEMVGIALFIYSLLAYLGAARISVVARVQP